MSLPKKIALQKWGPTVEDEEYVGGPKYTTDKTWMLPYEFQAPNKSNLLFKAGNRTYTLDGTSKGGSVSELSLRKKYA